LASATTSPEWLVARRARAATAAGAIEPPTFRGTAGWEFTPIDKLDLEAYPPAPGGDATSLFDVEGAVTVSSEEPTAEGPEGTDRKCIGPQLAGIRKAKQLLQIQVRVVIRLCEHPTESTASQLLKQYLMLAAHGEQLAVLRFDHCVHCQAELELLSAEVVTNLDCTQ